MEVLMFNKRLGDRIKLKRRLKKITQKELAEKLSVSAQAVSKWENGDNSPDIMHLPSIAEILETYVDWLLGNELEE